MSFTLFLPILAGPAVVPLLAQVPLPEAMVHFELRTPPKVGNLTTFYVVRVGPEQFQLRPGEAKDFNLALFPQGARIPVKIETFTKCPQCAVAMPAGQWETSELSIGSHHIEYVVTSSGQGKMAQWPLVTALAQKDTLDVYVDDLPRGTTKLEFTLRPNASHQLKWKKDGIIKCSEQIVLPPNVSRVRTCDPAAGKVN